MSQNTQAEMEMDVTTLYREDTFTDRKLGVIRCMTPVTAAGIQDATRAVLYLGQAEIMTNMGAVRSISKFPPRHSAKRWPDLPPLPNRGLSALCSKFKKCDASRPRSWWWRRACGVERRAYAGSRWRQDSDAVMQRH